MANPLDLLSFAKRAWETTQQPPTPEYGLGGVELRQPYPSEDVFFRGSPHVAGMATQDNKIALNPYSNLTPDQQAAVARNEAARVWMRRPDWNPNFDLTSDQAARFRRAARAAEFAPLDIEATIPAKAAQAEAQRQAIRDKYALIQVNIDAAPDVATLKAIVDQL